MFNSILRVLGLSAALVPVCHAAPPVDVLRFGDPASESAHGLSAETSSTGSGALGQPFRAFLPLGANDWRGGSASFTLKVKGKKQNYLSVRMWGGDVSGNQATLYCDGKQLGYRQLSDIDILDQGSKYPVAPGRFHYVTHVLPRQLTDGKRQIDCKLRVTGPVWRYGGEFARFQKPMTEASRGFYGLIVHTDKMVPRSGDDGLAPMAETRPAQSAAMLEKVRKRVDDTVLAIWALKRPANQLEISFMAKTFATPWSKGYQSPDNLKAIMAGIDGLWETYQKNPEIAYYDKATPNEGWFGFGLVGEALKITGAQLQKQLDAEVALAGGGKISRRKALERMFADSLDWNKRHRRLYTNQSMIKDLYGIWYNNEGLIALASPQAQAREALLPFFYESVGLLPWSGSVNERGEPTYAAAEADAKFSVPKDYMQTTRTGLTKELGYVGGYGEVLDWVSAIYEATRPAPGLAGDARIRDQLVKIAQARAYFRYPHWDHDGYRAMRLESAIGWRDVYAPSDIMYAQKPSWDASPLQAAVATGDPKLLGYAQQMIADNQFFPSIGHMMEAPSLRATIGMIDTINEYEQVKALPAQGFKLPMTAGQPDFVFADEEDGVVALKHGGDILYASLYWRANYGISGMGRVHYVNGDTDRVATVLLDRQEYQPSGLHYVRPDNPHINGTRFSIPYPEDGPVWTAGQRQPVAKLPDGSKYLPGEDNAYAGRADFYQLTYGRYLIAMNNSKVRRFDIGLPQGAKAGKDLVSGTQLSSRRARLTLAPGTTAVIFLDRD
jgi:hypothetical protein